MVGQIDSFNTDSFGPLALIVIVMSTRLLLHVRQGFSCLGYYHLKYPVFGKRSFFEKTLFFLYPRISAKNKLSKNMIFTCKNCLFTMITYHSVQNLTISSTNHYPVLFHNFIWMDAMLMSSKHNYRQLEAQRAQACQATVSSKQLVIVYEKRN
jgi:hypothetical protein